MDHIQQFAQALKSAGIQYSFGITGSGSSLRLISELEKSGIPYYPVAHEASAALMAGACCRDGRVRAAGITIKGPGFINMAPGFLANFYEGRPALTISEAYSPTIPSFRKHKRLDHFAVVANMVKGFATVDGKAETLTDFITGAQAEFPGPVHFDLYGEPADEIKKACPADSPQNDTQALCAQLAQIKAAAKPIVVLGSLAARQLSGWDWNSLQIPVLTTAAAKGCVDENGAFAAGVFTGEGKEISPEAMILPQADLVVAFGLRNVEVVKAQAFNAPLLAIDCIEGDSLDGFAPQSTLIGSDLAHECQAIFSELASKQWGEELVKSYHQAVADELLKEAWMPAQIFHRALQHFGKDCVLVLDTGLFCTVGETIWKAAGVDNFCGSSNGRFMGTSVPTAIAVAISSCKKTICAVGDGGLRPYLSEIKLAIEHNLPVLFLLFSDGAYGTVASSGRTKKLSENAFTIANPSWWRAVEQIGCPAQAVGDVETFAATLDKWQSGPLFVEMSFDPIKYATMTGKLR